VYLACSFSALVLEACFQWSARGVVAAKVNKGRRRRRGRPSFQKKMCRADPAPNVTRVAPVQTSRTAYRRFRASHLIRAVCACNSGMASNVHSSIQQTSGEARDRTAISLCSPNSKSDEMTDGMSFD
jgi:hypothetical protein